MQLLQLDLTMLKRNQFSLINIRKQQNVFYDTSKGKIDYGITFDGNKETNVELKGNVHANWGSNRNRRKSQSGYLSTVCRGLISLAGEKQSVVALSSTKAEYFAASLARQESSLAPSVNWRHSFRSKRANDD